MKNLLLIFALTLTVLGCKKNDNEIEMESILPSKTLPVAPAPPNNLKGEARHTDSLLKSGKLKMGDPSYITTRHTGDDYTYDIYYGSIGGNTLKPTDEYVKANKWCITWKYDNYERGGCSNIFLWHNAKSIQLGTTPKEIFYNKAYNEQSLVDGATVLEWMKLYKN